MPPKTTNIWPGPPKTTNIWPGPPKTTNIWSWPLKTTNIWPVPLKIFTKSIVYWNFEYFISKVSCWATRNVGSKYKIWTFIAALLKEFVIRKWLVAILYLCICSVVRATCVLLYTFALVTMVIKGTFCVGRS